MEKKNCETTKPWAGNGLCTVPFVKFKDNVLNCTCAVYNGGPYHTDGSDHVEELYPLITRVIRSNGWESGSCLKIRHRTAMNSEHMSFKHI